MTPMEQAFLARGRVPAEFVYSEIEASAIEEDVNPTFPTWIQSLADRSGVSFWKIEKIVYQRNRSVDFDDADKIFCALRKFDLWLEKYEEYYYGVNLSYEPPTHCEHKVELLGRSKVDACYQCHKQDAKRRAKRSAARAARRAAKAAA